MSVSDLFRWTEPTPKPARGTLALAREADDAERIAKERQIAAEVKKRDSWTCRWPEKHKCRGPLEAAHIINKSLGGPTSLENELAVCRWIHRHGPESLHGGQLKVVKETARGANWILSFWRRTEEKDALGDPVFYMVARESSPGVLERD